MDNCCAGDLFLDVMMSEGSRSKEKKECTGEWAMLERSKLCADRCTAIENRVVDLKLY